MNKAVTLLKEKLHAKKRITAVLMTVIILAVSVFMLSGKGDNGSADGDMQMLQTVKIEKQDLKNSFSVTGTVTSVDINQVSSTLTGTEVKEVYVSVGDKVKEGDIICILDSKMLEEKLALEQKNLNIDKAKSNAEISSAQSNLSDAQTTKSIENKKAANDTAQALQRLNNAAAEEDNAKKALENSKSKKSEIERNIGQINQKLAEATNEAAKRQQEKDSLNEQKAALIEQINNLEKQIEELEKEKQESDETVSGNEAVQATTEGNADLQAQIDRLKEQKASLEQNLASVQNELEKADKLLAQAQESLQNIEGNKSAAERALEEMKADISSKEESNKAGKKEKENYQEAYEKAVVNENDVLRNQNTAVRTSEEALKNAQLNASAVGGQSEITISELEKQIQECTVKAPMDGTITAISVKTGEPFQAGTVAVIQNLDAFKVTASIDQYDIAKIKEGMEAVISLDAAGQETIKGIVSFVSPVPQAVSGTGSTQASSQASYASYNIDITLKESNDKLKSGMILKTELIIEQKEKCLAIPYNCLQIDENNETYISVVEQDADGNQIIGKVIVNKTFETNYYVGIEAENIKEGMEILVPGEISLEGTEIYE